MLEQGLITARRLPTRRTRRRCPSPTRSGSPDSGKRVQYFAEYVKQQLIPYYGSGEVFGGGLKVYTSIDLELQQLAREAIDKWLAEPDGPTAALVAIDPRDGRVLAMVGGESFRKSQFNLAVQGERQTGSSFKPFVLAAALEQGISPQTVFESEPTDDQPRRQALGGAPTTRARTSGRSTSPRRRSTPTTPSTRS